jgi:hypothetical protein
LRFRIGIEDVIIGQGQRAAAAAVSDFHGEIGRAGVENLTCLVVDHKFSVAHDPHRRAFASDFGILKADADIVLPFAQFGEIFAQIHRGCGGREKPGNDP